MMNAYKRFQHQAGVTMIEVMVTLLVVSFGLLALSKLQSQITIAGSISRQRAEATEQAQAKLDIIRNMAFNNISAGGTNCVSSSATGTVATYSFSCAVATCDATTLTCPAPTGTPTSNIVKQVTITTTWAGQDSSATQSVSLNTLISP
ncbi:type IV pilus assembly protein PilV [Andreprevotia lacus DSM 23236]|jgi:type IV pilus assembly protein PilV|uniref:Type IV pilus assembly protein PilV n=1 Tax=Andreprevotia lacus DSM 23236 TaxID=1121001 RepID=A0A1W1XD81_9NEIS|nr:prepilin-type N-terminal cleavage/methylation domain-containing protein [Andreprevotia lacus]SMC21853.1 type IV pilus assembly protein PilV [Andreprevotia lacus DSM 23236]